jgi:DNA-binding MarR family transcriptional regulator
VRTKKVKNDDRLIYQIFMAQQKLRTYIGQVLAKAGVRVTLIQAGILFLLEQEDGQTMTALSKALAVENPTLTGLIDRLEKAGFVRRQTSPDDRRAIKITMTPEGLKEGRKVKPLIRKINREIKSGISQEGLEVFQGILQGLARKFDKTEKGGKAPPESKHSGRTQQSSSTRFSN